MEGLCRLEGKLRCGIDRIGAHYDGSSGALVERPPASLLILRAQSGEQVALRLLSNIDQAESAVIGAQAPHFRWEIYWHIGEGFQLGDLGAVAGEGLDNLRPVGAGVDRGRNRPF